MSTMCINAQVLQNNILMTFQINMLNFYPKFPDKQAED